MGTPVATVADIHQFRFPTPSLSHQRLHQPPLSTQGHGPTLYVLAPGHDRGLTLSTQRQQAQDLRL